MVATQRSSVTQKKQSLFSGASNQILHDGICPWTCDLQHSEDCFSFFSFLVSFLGGTATSNVNRVILLEWTFDSRELSAM